MANRKGRRGSEHGSSNRAYRVPLGLDYNEFVGALGPSNGGVYPELHVRYGVRDNLYLDWAITLQMRLGGIEQMGPGKPALWRRRWQRLVVERSAIRRYKFDLRDARRPAEVEVLQELHVGDEQVVHQAYTDQLTRLAQSWVANHGDDPHTGATFGYALRNLDPEFRNSESFSWVRDTVIALHSDQADDAFSDRTATYFPNRPTTAGVLLPDGIMKFIRSAGPAGAAPADWAAESGEGEEGNFQARGALTMGMLVSTIYGGANLAQQVEEFLSGE
ncbi:hypothetical protein ACWDXV_33900 [Nocardia nova]